MLTRAAGTKAKPNAQEARPAGFVAPIAGGRLAAVAVVAPATAPEHPGGLLLPEVEAPLPNVAVHVKQAETVGLEAANPCGALQIWSLFCSSIGIIAVEVGFARRESVGGLVLEIEVEGAFLL